MVGKGDSILIGPTRYELLSPLAAGGMGKVYLACQHGWSGFQKTIAIKMILSRFERTEEFVLRFIGEAKLVADLIHENIVQVYQLGSTPDQYYIVMEYIDGVDLLDFIQAHTLSNTALDPDVGAFVISRVCKGLQYAHNKCARDGQPLGVVHGDIAPRNIMISLEGVVKVTDFGIAKARHLVASQEGSVLMGHLAYMSPEQARGEETDQRSDLFSLGTVMFELLTGQCLFGGQSIRETLANVVRAKLPDLQSCRSELPEALAKIVSRALERDLTKRYQTAAEMGNDLEHYLYHDRFGPTNLKLGAYVRRMCSDMKRKPEVTSQRWPTGTQLGWHGDTVTMTWGSSR